MDRSRILAVAAQLTTLVFGLGILAWVWTRSDPHEHSPTATTWLKQLHARDGDDRKQAAQELGGVGANDIPAVMPALIAALGDGDPSVRNEAVLALPRCLADALKARGPALAERARDGVTSLTAVLERDGDAGVRASAAFASAALVRAARSAGIKPDGSRIDDPIDPKTLARTFDAAITRDPSARLALLAPYQTLGPQDGEAPRVLIASLGDPSRTVRVQALLVISQFASGVDAAVPVMLKEAAFINPRSPMSVFQLELPIREAAERMHPTTAVLPLLVASLESRNAAVRTVAVLLLDRLGPNARPAAPSLTAVAHDVIRASQGSTRSSDDRFFADLGFALAHILPLDDAVAILREAAGPDHYAIQGDAISALAHLGPRAAAAIPTVLAALESARNPATGPVRERLAYQALYALRQIAPAASLPAEVQNQVIEAASRSLDFPVNYVRAEAAWTLSEFGPRAACALPKLRALEESAKEDSSLRSVAADTIEQIEKNAERRQARN
jgi:hypothetical protein